jgi:asparagine synthetase B (glutamine-hydrolysing)
MRDEVEAPSFRTGSASATTLGKLVASRALSKPNRDFLGLSLFHDVMPPAFDTAFEGATADFGIEPVGDLLADAPVGRTVQDGAACLRRAIEDTLDRKLRGKQHVAVLTGGGLDSGGLLALVAKWAQRSGAQYFGVAMDFEGPGDDRPYLRDLEQKLKCRLERVAPEEGAEFASLLATGIDGAPLISPTTFIEVAAFRRARRAGADAIVTGVGGDGLFDGNPRALSNLLRRHQTCQAWNGADRLRGFFRPRLPFVQWAVRPFITEALPLALRGRLARIAPLPNRAWASPRVQRSLRDERHRRREQLRARISGREPLILNLHRVLARHRQMFEMASGVQRIDPFADPSLRAYCCRIPPEWFLHGDIRRGLFRAALEDLLPASLFRREDKAGFEPAINRLARVAWSPALLRDLARAPALQALGVVRSSALQHAWERLLVQPANGALWAQVWPALAVEAFSQNHFGIN